MNKCAKGGALMKSAVYYGIEDIKIEEQPIPEIGDGGILIKNSYCAICGTDVRIFFNGQANVIPPRITGHEVSGIIAKVGKNVTDYKIGDRVIVAPQISCGKCLYCLKGDGNMCPESTTIGYGYDGGFAEYMAVPDIAVAHGNVIKVDEDMDLKYACVAEPLSCVINGHKNLNIRPGDTVLVIGAGPIGAMHVALSRAEGSADVILADIEDKRLELAKELGADYTINSQKLNLEDELMKITNNAGVDVVICACSVPMVQKQALSVAKKGGRISFFAGLPKGHSINSLDINLAHYKELSIFGSYCSTAAQHIVALKLIKSNTVDARKLVTDFISLDELVDGIKSVKNGNGLKTVVKF